MRILLSTLLDTVLHHMRTRSGIFILTQTTMQHLGIGSARTTKKPKITLAGLERAITNYLLI